jgi:hypothetical protein
MLLYLPNLGKTCPIIFLSLMPLVSSYPSKAYQLNLMIVFPPYLIDTNPWPWNLCDGHKNMLGAELTVSHHTPSSTNLGYGHALFISSSHDLFGSLLYIVTPFLNPFVSCEISYWLRLVLVLWLKRWCCDETKGLLLMYTHGYATWHTLVSRLVVIIHYETISMHYFCTIYFFTTWDSLLVPVQW